MSVTCAVAILAGGRATRLGGRNKALIEIEGEPILARQLRAVEGLTDEILIVARNQDAFREFGVRVVVDRHPGLGPLAGLDAALANARASRVLLIACDMPELSTAVCAHLLTRATREAAELVVPEVAGRLQPLCGVYGAAVAPVVTQQLRAGRLRARELPDAAERAGLRVVRVGEADLTPLDPKLRSFENLNSVGDRGRWEP